MSSEVYFASVRAKSRQESLASKIEKFFVKAGFEQIAGKDELVAIKLHFGEAGTTNFIKPISDSSGQCRYRPCIREVTLPK